MFYFDYSSNSCKCRPDSPTVCSGLGDFFFSTETCSCLPNCNSGEFLNSLGNCQATPDTDCLSYSDYFYFDLTTNLCAEYPRPCSDDKNWDSLTQECIYTPLECVFPEYWLFDFGMCHCPEVDCGAGLIESCDCNCTPITCLVAGETWDPIHCRCACLPPLGGCPAGEYWDTRYCECKLVPEICPTDYFWDDAAGVCQCQPEVCQFNLIWDSVLCRCESTPIDCGSVNETWSISLHKCISKTDVCDTTNPNYELFFDNIAKECVCVDPGTCNDNLPGGTTNKYWDVTTCSCRFEFDALACAEGQYLDTNIGTCKYYSDCNCAHGFLYNYTTGVCDCYPQICPVDFYWDTESCTCRCFPNEPPCVVERYWDSYSCQCECIWFDCLEGEYFDTTDCTCQPFLECL